MLSRGRAELAPGLYGHLIELALGGPTLLISYLVMVWSLAADLGLTTSFPWSKGPLSNWMVWLIFAVLQTVVSRMLKRPARLTSER